MSLGRAEVRFWGPLDIPRAELGLALRSLGSPSRLESNSVVPKFSQSSRSSGFWGPRVSSADQGPAWEVVPQGLLRARRRAVVRVRQSQSKLGFPARVALQSRVAPQPSGSGLRGRTGPAYLRTGSLQGCQDPGPTDFAGTRPRHSTSMPGFLQDFVGNAHLSKGKTTEFAQISELTFALKKVQFFSPNEF